MLKERLKQQNESFSHDVPSGAYMCAEQLEFFRTLLAAEKSVLLNNIHNTLGHLKELDTLPDSNDRASMEEEYQLELRVRDRERKLLKKIDKALMRIEQGTYGWCSETGEPIGIGRLLARPTASLCVEAQERHEMNNRLYDD